MKKILFLDIDGVLKVNEAQMELWHDATLFSSTACRNLSRIIKETGCKIVISSSWRHYHSGKEIEAMLHSEGVVEAAVIGVTDEIWPGIRGQEVDRSVRLYGPDRYVIIDDYTLTEWLASQINNLVITDPEVGLTSADADKAIEVLNK